MSHNKILILSDSEDGGKMLLRNINSDLSDYIAVCVARFVAVRTGYS
jgi:hypothetical protein